MAGTQIDIDYNDAEVLAAFNRLLKRSTDLTPAMGDIGASMVLATEERFDQQRDPEGNPWQDLKPETWARKKNSKILSEQPHLRHSIDDRADDQGVSWGTNVVYGAIHQFGGTIEMPARSQQAYFRQDARSGEVGNRFVRKSRSNFAQWVTLPAYSIEIPARPYLGISDRDRQQVLEILREHLDLATA